MIYIDQMKDATYAVTEDWEKDGAWEKEITSEEWLVWSKNRDIELVLEQNKYFKARYTSVLEWKLDGINEVEFILEFG